MLSLVLAKSPTDVLETSSTCTRADVGILPVKPTSSTVVVIICSAFLVCSFKNGGISTEWVDPTWGSGLFTSSSSCFRLASFSCEVPSLVNSIKLLENTKESCQFEAHSAGVKKLYLKPIDSTPLWKPVSGINVSAAASSRL